MTRALSLLLCGALLASTTGCISRAGYVQRKSEKIQEGMTKAEVQKKLGPPVETFPVPGQGDDPRLVVEFWRFEYHWPGALLWLMAVTLLLIPFIDWKHYTFKVGFDREGKVRRVTDVEPVR